MRLRCAKPKARAKSSRGDPSQVCTFWAKAQVSRCDGCKFSAADCNRRHYFKGDEKKAAMKRFRKN